MQPRAAVLVGCVAAISLTGCLAQVSRITVRPAAEQPDPEDIATSITRDVAIQFGFRAAHLAHPRTLADGTRVLATFHRYESTPMTYDQSLHLSAKGDPPHLEFVLWNYETETAEFGAEVREALLAEVRSRLPGCSVEVNTHFVQTLRP